MFTRFIKKWLKSDEDIPHEAVVPRDQHNVSRKLIGQNALKVMNRLHNAGFEAFLVGGGVRDILLGLRPKDFDIATNAKPEEIKRLFRNCRLIGRRFRLAHILFGREIIEVATFRAGHQNNHPSGKQHESGMLVRDNVYGTLEEDALRRDFTVNALYYSSKDFSVRDFTGGLSDLAKRELKLIGDPIERYKEDPVRMLRAIRLATKLNLSLAPSASKPIPANANLLTNVSPARLWDESHKLLLAGHAYETFHNLRQFDLLKYLFPATEMALLNDPNEAFARFVNAALNSTDQRAKQDKPLTPAFLYAVFLWAPLQARCQQLQDQGMGWNDAYHKAMGQVISEQTQFIGIPKRFSMVMRDIWSLQPRLERPNHKAYRLLEMSKFRAAYDFLVLRSASESTLEQVANWWTEYQEQDANGQKQMQQALGNNRKTPKTKRRRHKPRRRPQKKPDQQ